MPLQLVVKNTFICALGEEEAEAASPACASRRRHRTLHPSTFSKIGGWEDGACSSGEETAATSTPSSPSSCSSSPGGQGAAVAELAELADDLGGASARELAVDAAGAEALGRAAAQARPRQLRALLAGLRGSVREMVRSPHGSELLQQLVHVAGTEDAAFIAEELLPEAATVALNSNASPVLCRLVEYSPEHASTAALVDGVLAAVGPATLIGHKFGHHVVVALLSNGLPHQRRLISEALLGDVQRFARHRFASYVLEQALTQVSAEEAERLSLAVLGKAGTVVALACHHSGAHVVRALLEGPCGQQVLGYLRKASQRLAKDRYGSELLKGLAPGQLMQAATA